MAFTDVLDNHHDCEVVIIPRFHKGKPKQCPPSVQMGPTLHRRCCHRQVDRVLVLWQHRIHQPVVHP
jgi:hypothetical protein